MCRNLSLSLSLSMLVIAGCSTPAPPPPESLQWWSSAQGWSDHLEQEQRKYAAVEKVRARLQAEQRHEDEARASALAALREVQLRCFQQESAMAELNSWPGDPVRLAERERAARERAAALLARPASRAAPEREGN
jgi:hypothetical protein